MSVIRCKAISLWQPWATLMALGVKRIETRGWATRYRGPLAIHAAKRWTADQWRRTLSIDRVPGVIRAAGYALTYDNTRCTLPFGAIVGVVTLYGTCKTEVVSRGRLDVPHAASWPTDGMLGNYDAGRVAWLTRNPRRTKVPIPMCGRQRLWNVDIDKGAIEGEM